MLSFSAVIFHFEVFFRKKKHYFTGGRLIGSLVTLKLLKNGRNQHKVSVLKRVHHIEVSVKRELTVYRSEKTIFVGIPRQQ